MAEGKAKITFFSKKPISCPVCRTKFHRENLLTGGGRMIAGELTEDLHRQYETSQKYGDVYPLIYPVTVCPTCYYAAYEKDFSKIEGPVSSRLEGKTSERQKSVEKIFPELDFTDYRGLQEGAASYHLAVMCYDDFPSEMVPTFRQALSSIRAAWLFKDLHALYPGENYDYLANIYYRKAAFFYRMVVENEQSGKESMGGIGHFGPDIDNNYGYDGILYLMAYLEFHYGPREDPAKRLKNLVYARQTVSRIVGMGKSSKSKPSALLDMGRDMHKLIGAEISDLEDKVGDGGE